MTRKEGKREAGVNSSPATECCVNKDEESLEDANGAMVRFSTG